MDRVKAALALGCAALVLTACAVQSQVSPESDSTPPFPQGQVPSSSPDASASLATSERPDPANSGGRTGPYAVVRVVDGDTLDVTVDGVRTRVRVVGINTPETVDPRRPVQCYGPESSAEAKRLLAGETVWLETDPAQSATDSFGRRLAFVWIDNRSDFGLTMIKGGYATEFTYRLAHRYQKQYRAAEATARAEAVGLWSPATCAGKYRSSG